MMSGASLAAILVARVSAASVLSTTVSLRSMQSCESLKAATTASSCGICSSFSPVPRPTYHSISTGVQGVALGASVAVAAGVPEGVGEAPLPHAAPTRTTAARATGILIHGHWPVRWLPFMRSSPPSTNQSLVSGCAIDGLLSFRPPLARPAAHQLGGENHLAGHRSGAGRLLKQEADHLAAHLLDGLPDAREGRLGRGRDRRVVEADDRHVLGDPAIGRPKDLHRTGGHEVGGREHGVYVGSGGEDPAHRLGAALLREIGRDLEARLHDKTTAREALAIALQPVDAGRH